MANRDVGMNLAFERSLADSNLYYDEMKVQLESIQKKCETLKDKPNAENLIKYQKSENFRTHIEFMLDALLIELNKMRANAQKIYDACREPEDYKNASVVLEKERAAYYKYAEFIRQLDKEFKGIDNEQLIKATNALTGLQRKLDTLDPMGKFEQQINENKQKIRDMQGKIASLENPPPRDNTTKKPTRQEAAETAEATKKNIESLQSQIRECNENIYTIEKNKLRALIKACRETNNFERLTVLRESMQNQLLAQSGTMREESREEKEIKERLKMIGEAMRNPERTLTGGQTPLPASSSSPSPARSSSFSSTIYAPPISINSERKSSTAASPALASTTSPESGSAVSTPSATASSATQTSPTASNPATVAPPATSSTTTYATSFSGSATPPPSKWRAGSLSSSDPTHAAAAQDPLASSSTRSATPLRGAVALREALLRKNAAEAAASAISSETTPAPKSATVYAPADSSMTAQASRWQAASVSKPASSGPPTAASPAASSGTTEPQADPSASRPRSRSPSRGGMG